MATRLTALLMLAVVAMAGPAYADCPTQPDGANSNYVQNGQSQTLCLNRQLNDSSRTLQDNAQWNNLETSVQRNQIQRRFDNMPPVTNNRLP